MTSLQRVIGLHIQEASSPSLLFSEAGVLVLVVLLSIPAFVSFTRWLVSQRQTYRALSGFYEDEDGEATSDEQRQGEGENVGRIPVLVHVGCAVALAITRSCLLLLLPKPITETWLRWLLAGFLVLQSTILCIPLSPRTRYRLGLHSGLSYIGAAAAQCFWLFHYHTGEPGLQPQPPRWHAVTECAQLALAITAAVSALLIQRRPDVFHHGAVVDRQHTASFLGRLSFSWALPLLRACKQHERLEVYDLPELDHKTRAANLFASFRFRDKQDNTKGTKSQVEHRPLWRVILRAHGSSLGIQLLLSLTSTFLAFVPRLALQALLKELDAAARAADNDNLPSSSSSSHRSRLWLYLAVLGTSTVASNILTVWKSWMAVNIISLRVYAQLSSALYAKRWRLDAAAQASSDDDDDGQGYNVVNAVANEAKGIAGFAGDSYQLLETPLKLACCGVLLCRLLGWQSLLAGVLVVVLGGPAQGFLAKRLVAVTRAMLGWRDARMAVLSEMLHGVRQVKFLAAEDEWEARVNRARDTEVRATERTVRYQVLISSLYLTQPIVLAVVMLSVHTLLHPHWSAATAFTSLTVLSLVEQALDTLPFLQMRLINVVVFMRRIEDYLRQPERVPYVIPSEQIVVEDATIQWPGSCGIGIIPSGQRPSSSAALSKVSLRFPVGKLSLVCGKTGSGKSLLLSSLVQEADLTAGQIRAPVGSHRSPAGHPAAVPSPSPSRHQTWLLPQAIAFVSQTPWIETGTIRSNILFGAPHLPSRYDAVLSACALRPDIALLPDGDQTQVGGGGVALSGGQKSRIALARALYSQARTLVLDDIFSAVDVHTARHLLEHALTGPLAEGRTRVLATYRVDLCLTRAAYLVTLDGRGGCRGDIVTEADRAAGAIGLDLSFEEHAGVDDGDGNDDEWKDDVSISPSLFSVEASRSVCSMASAHTLGFQGLHDASSVHDAANIRPLPVTNSEGQGQVGHVQWQTIRDFSKYSGSVSWYIFFVALFVISGALNLGRGYVTRAWTTQPNNPSTTPPFTNTQYLLFYSTISLLYILTGTLRIHVALSIGLRGSAAIFRRVLHRVLRARLRWLDTVPLGNLLSRFSEDLSATDLQIGNSLKQLLFCAAGILTAIASAALEADARVVVPLASGLVALTLWCARDYVAAARQLKRLESSAMGPLLDALSTSPPGMATVRAWRREEDYVAGFLDKMDGYARASWHLWLLNRWMGFWMNVVGASFVTATAASLLAGVPRVDAGAAGLAISFTMQLGDYLVNAVQAYAAFEMNMNSVHRLLEYTQVEMEEEQEEEEGEGGHDHHGDDKPRSQRVRVLRQQPPAGWPTRGRLEVSEMVARYSPELPPALRDVNFVADATQRIGVVGRTGAGKSSLALALMRFLDVEGQIRIDGVDVSRVPLRRLRKAVQLIPQSPVLFSGTVRSNLDPLHRHDDTELLSALESVHWMPARYSDDDSSTAAGKPQEVMLKNSSAELESQPEPGSTHLGDGRPATSTKTLPGDGLLQHAVAEGGTNLSLGERQLLCLARAIVNRPKVLILDESTSSVDHTIDAQIQQSIRSEFRHSSTLIVIAHRLSTVVDFDRILVLDQGRVAEFGTPAQLMMLEGGLFRSLVEQDAQRGALEEVIHTLGRDE
ncbi:hypothetical protein F4777DRAFT_204213 [Nemania sp. FL0916]|nr:hypothetical protein F4777DRAFT_204213 [Nemania sp. FL0916]